MTYIEYKACLFESVFRDAATEEKLYIKNVYVSCTAMESGNRSDIVPCMESRSNKFVVFCLYTSLTSVHHY